MCLDLQMETQVAKSEDIVQEFAISVSSAVLRENTRRYANDQKEVFMVHRRDNLLAPIPARHIEIKGTSRMVHAPTTPLPSTRAVAWIETNGPIILHTDEGTFELNTRERSVIEKRMMAEENT
jgi:hypothetical protein